MRLYNKDQEVIQVIQMEGYENYFFSFFRVTQLLLYLDQPLVLVMTGNKGRIISIYFTLVFRY